MKNQRLASALEQEILDFIDLKKSLMLALVDSQTKPLASYSPFVVQNDSLCILVSALAHHTAILQGTDVASVLIMDDEQDCETIYARRRLQYEMRVTAIKRDSEQWNTVGEVLLARHGDIVSQLLQLGDFHMFQLSPISGRFVKGFGRAYELSPNTLASDQLDHIRG